MKHPTRRFWLATAVLGLAAGQARAALFVDSPSPYEIIQAQGRESYSRGTFSFYGDSFSNGQGIDFGYAINSGSSTVGPGSGIAPPKVSFDLSSEMRLTANASASFFSFFGMQQFHEFLHTDTTAAYDVTATASAGVSPSGSGSAIGSGHISLYDQTTGTAVYVYDYEYLDGDHSFSAAPVRVTLTAGDSYLFSGYSLASGRVGSLDVDAGAATGGAYVLAEVGGVLTEAVPEPSSLVLSSIAGVIGLGHAWRRRKARRAA